MGFQLSIRMEDELHNKAEKAAKEAGQTLAEWVRRAMKEKLEREEQASSFVTRAEFEDLQNRIMSMEKIVREAAPDMIILLLIVLQNQK